MEALELLARYNVPFVESAIAKTPEEALQFAESIGYPIAMKIATDHPVHKTDIGAVRLNVPPEGVKQAFTDILKSAIDAGVDYEGVFVQQMAKPGIEVIIGLKQDPTFGPVILFGLGGIYAEALRDVSIRVCPITKQDAEEMIGELKSAAVFHSRGMQYDTAAIINLLMKVSAIAITERIKEMDLNPVIVYPVSETGSSDVNSSEGKSFENEKKSNCLVVDVRVVKE